MTTFQILFEADSFSEGCVAIERAGLDPSRLEGIHLVDLAVYQTWIKAIISMRLTIRLNNGDTTMVTKSRVRSEERGMGATM